MHEALKIQAAFEQESAAHRHAWMVRDRDAGRVREAIGCQDSAAFWAAQARDLMGIAEEDQFYA